MIRNFFDRLGASSFKNIAILFCLAGDVMISIFIWTRFSNKEQFSEYFQASQKILKQAFEQQGMALPPNLESEIFAMMIQSLILMLVLFVIFHIIIYSFYFFTKRFAYLYVKFLSWVGIFGAILFSIQFFSAFPGWGLLFFLQFIFYTFCAIGFRYYPILPKSLQEQ